MTRTVQIGSVTIGGGASIAVQSMLNRPASDISGNVRQARALEAAGCDIIRVAVPDRASVRLVEQIRSAVRIPLVADLHFDYRSALDCVAAGIDKIRILETSATTRMCAPSLTHVRLPAFRFVSASIPVLWKSRSLPNTARRRRRRLLTAPCIMHGFWNGLILTTLSYQLSRQMSQL